MKTHCEDCGKLTEDYRMEWREDGTAFCKKCAEHYKVGCFGCGKQEFFWNMSSTSHDEIYCEKCATAIA